MKLYRKRERGSDMVTAAAAECSDIAGRRECDANR